MRLISVERHMFSVLRLVLDLSSGARVTETQKLGIRQPSHACMTLFDAICIARSDSENRCTRLSHLI